MPNLEHQKDIAKDLKDLEDAWKEAYSMKSDDPKIRTFLIPTLIADAKECYEVWLKNKLSYLETTNDVTKQDAHAAYIFVRDVLLAELASVNSNKTELEK